MVDKFGSLVTDRKLVVIFNDYYKSMFVVEREEANFSVFINKKYLLKSLTKVKNENFRILRIAHYMNFILLFSKIQKSFRCQP